LNIIAAREPSRSQVNYPLFFYYLHLGLASVTFLVHCERDTSVGEKNVVFFIRAGKSLHSRRVLKTLKRSSKGKAQRGQYLLVVGLDCYNWYQSQTLGDVPGRRLSSEGVHEAVCQRGCWTLKEVDWGIPHRLKKGTSASEDVGPRRGVDCEIPYWLGRRTKHFL